jgi:uncharacterized protein YigE (DUF2233 family)
MMTVAQIKPGMTIHYNFGYSYTVLSCEPVKSSVRLVLLDKSGKEWKIIKRASTLVAAQ